MVFWPSPVTREVGVLVGMLYGDGHIASRDSALRTGKWLVHFCEGDYGTVREYLRLTGLVFNLRPSVRRRGNWWEAYYCSRVAYEYLTSVAEHPAGRKAGRLHVPAISKETPEVTAGFLRGIFSVEGSVKISSNIRLAIEMLEPELIPGIASMLRSFDLRPHTYRYQKAGKVMYGTYVYGVEEVSSFLERIGLFGKKESKARSFISKMSALASARS